jgi:hypothetical protein
MFTKHLRKPNGFRAHFAKYFFVAIALLAFAGGAWGQTTFTWNGGNGNWNVAGNWVKVGGSTSTWPGQNAGQQDFVVINSTGTVTIPTDITNTSIKDVNINSGTLITDNTNRQITINGNLVIANGATFNAFRGSPITVQGTTTINGILTDSNASGASTVFNGLVTINGSGAITNTVTLTGYTFNAGLVNNGSFTSTNTAPMVFRNGITNNGTFNQTGTGAVTLANTQTITGANAISFAGTVTVSAGANITNTNSGGITFNGLLDGANATTSIWTNGANGVIYYQPAAATQPMNTGVLDATATGNTVNYSRNNTQTCKPTTYFNLTLSNTSAKTTTGVTVNGVLSMEGTATASAAPTYGSNATLQYNTATARNAGVEWLNTFAATGGVIIANTGTITMNAAKVFNENVPLTINSGATLATNNLQLTLGGDFNNSGTFTGGTSNIIIANTAATQGIDGFTTTGTVSMTKTSGTATFRGNVNGAGLTINGVGGTLNLGADLTHTITGVWTRTNGTLDGGSSTLRLGGSPAGTGGIFTASNGTVNYYAAGAQTLAGVVYNNLILSGSGVKTTTGVTVNGVLSMEETATASAAPTYGSNATLQYNTATARNAGVEWLNTFAATGGVIIANTGTITMNAAKVFNANVPLTINLGATLATGNFQLTFGGDFNNSGTFTGGSSNIIIANTAATQGIDGFTTTGTVSMTKTSGTATFRDNVNGGVLTIDGVGGTLNLGEGITHTFTGNWNRTNGILLGGSSNLLIGGSVVGTDGTFTPNTSTVHYYAAGAQTVAGITYYNLTISGSNVKTLGAATSVTNNLTILGTATLACDVYTLTGNAVGSFTMTSGTGLTLGNTGNATATPFPTGFTSNKIFFNPSSTVTYQSTGAQTISVVPTYGSLSIATGGAKTATGTLNIGGNLTVNAGSLNFGASATTINLSGNLSGAGTINMTGAAIAHILNMGGSTNAIGTFNTTPSSGSTVNYNRAGDQQVFSATYQNLTVSGSGVKTMQNVVTVSNNLTVNGGSSFSTGAFALTGGTGTLAINDNSYLLLGNPANTANISFPTFSGGYTLSSTSTVVYQTDAAQVISTAPGYGNLSITNSSATARIKTATGNLTVNGDLNINYTGTGVVTFSFGATASSIKTVAGSITGNGTVDMSTAATQTLNIGGNNLTTGTFTPGTGTVNYNGISITQIVRGTTYNNLTVSGGDAKYLGAATTVTGIVSLNGAILQLGSFNLSVTNTGVGAFVEGATYSDINMIETNGSGLLIKSGTATPSPAGLNIVYPIGAGGYYSPMNLTAFTATGGGTTVSVRAEFMNQGASTLKRRWYVTSTYTGITATVRFTYNNPFEVSGNQSLYTPWFWNGATWVAPASPTAVGVNPFGGTNTLVGQWTAGEVAPATVSGPFTYYSYQSGNWNRATTWTTDPSGTELNDGFVPGTGDNVVILSGRTVTATATGINLNSLEIREGGILDIGSTTITTFGTVTGTGTLRMANSTFPTGTFTNFVSSAGGTIEYNNTSSFNLPTTQATYNNLVINTPGFIATQISNITLNGNLHIKQGTLQINGTTANRRQLTINGNVTVDFGASFTVGTGVTNTTTAPATPTGGTQPFTTYYDSHSHRVVIMGDFTNNGTVRFTNLTNPVYNLLPPTTLVATSGYASVFFQGSSNTTLTCNGTTDFYNLIVNKGTDQTYSLSIYSTAYSNFRLFGANIAAIESSVANPNVRKALWLQTGTLILKGLVAIPSLTEGVTAAAPFTDFIIPQNAALQIDGTSVIVLSTADDFTEVNAAYGLTGGSNAAYGINTGSGGSGIAILGKLEINDGYLSTRESGGFSYWSYASGQFILNKGTVDAKQFFNPQGGTTALVSYMQTGGNFILRGRFQNANMYVYPSDLTSPSINTARVANGTVGTAGIGTFHICANAANGYGTTGGTMSIYDVTGTTATSYAFFVGSPVANNNVSGGTVQFIPTSGSGLADANYLINSLSSLGNLTINRAIGASEVQLNTNPIVVLGNLNLQSGVFRANNLNVTIGGNLTLANGTTYITGSNTTLLNGTDNQTITINRATPVSFNKLTIEKATGLTVAFAGSQKTVNVLGDFRLAQATLNDNGNTIYLSSNVFNSGVHSGLGKIVLNGTTAQTIDGGGIFQNLDLNNTSSLAAPVSLVANTTINGALNLVSEKIFNIDSYNLKITSAGSISIGSFGNSRYIHSKGQAGDGGITKEYTNNNDFVFPVGCFSTKRPSTYAYTPATIGFTSSPSPYGDITVVPVGYEHPATTVKANSLGFYWRVKNTGIGNYAGKVSHTFVYSPLDIQGTVGNYIPSVYNLTDNTWNSGLSTNINTGTYTITDWTTPADSRNFLGGDYTAGDNTITGPPAGSFGVPRKFYSRINGSDPGNGLWSDANNWSLTSHTGPADTGGAYPGAGDIVVIGERDSIYLSNEAFPLPNNTDPAVTYFQLNKAKVSCASLQIEVGSCLDIQNNPGSNFGMVLSHPSGNGNFRVTTRDPGTFDNTYTLVFPSGDFSDYNSNRGTTEFYGINPQIGTLLILPQNANSYGTVIMSPLRQANMAFPNISQVTIYGDLITRGSTWESWLAMTWTTGYGTIVPKTVYVKGNMYLQGGTFVYMSNGTTAQSIIIDGDLEVFPGAGIDVYGTTTANTMAIGGSLINNTTNSNTVPDASAGDAGSNVRFYASATRRCDVLFFGPNNAFITNTGTTPATGSTPNTVFYTVTVNKGNSPLTTLTCNIGGLMNTGQTVTITGATSPSVADNWLTLQNGTFVYSRTGNLTISTGTVLNIPATAGLTIDNTASNVIIGTNTASGTILSLSGKLKTTSNFSGSILVGTNGTTANHNDIEYSSGGLSEIEINGGTLVVNGQIRRNTSTSAGVLNYKQTGSSTVNILGNSVTVAPTNANNAKLEVLNTGSSFSMLESSTLNISRGGGGTTFGDLYLRPETGTVTGGSIVFTPGALGAQTYRLDATIPLNILTITGGGGANTANVSLLISPLVVNGNLTISNATSTLDANVSTNIPLTIKGNFTNSGTYTPRNNLTTFSGNAQQILGTTASTFWNLTVNPVTSVTSTTTDITVSNNLTLSSGTLILGNRRVSIGKDFANNANYTDNNVANSGARLNGTTLQQISGTGTFGRLELANAAGTQLNNDISLQENLVLTNGILNLKQHLLTLGSDSNIDGAPFSSSKMIVTDGVFSNIGITKFFKIGTSATFTYPLGTSGKYTPAELKIDASNSVASFRINGINSKQPTVIDPNNVLQYYWDVESSGVSAFSGSLVFTYVESDVTGGPESSYFASRLIVPGYSWSKTSTVNAGTNRITFNFGPNEINLSGQYTAGLPEAIPDNVPEFTSNGSGNWNDNTKWTQTNGSEYILPEGTGPNGFIVIIDQTDEISTNTNYCSAYALEINGKLKVISPYVGHNFGTVAGNGTLYLESGTFPAGRYTEFFDCINDGTLEYGGVGNYNIVADLYNSVPNLKISGSGTRTLPNKNLTICDKLTIGTDTEFPTLDNSVNNKTLYLLGSMERIGTSIFKAGTGNNATVGFNGTAPQKVGDFTGTSSFNNLEINNPAGLTVNTNKSIEVGGKLILTNGIIHTSSTSTLSITNTAINSVTPLGGSASSYVSGPMTKKVIQGDNFLFPIGKNTSYGNKLNISATSIGPLFWTSEYFDENTSYTNITPPLQGVSAKEFWTVKTTASSQSYININWDPYSDITPLITPKADIRLARFTTSWEEMNTSAVGDNYNGTASSTSLVTSTGSDDYTLASVSSLKARAKMTPTGSVCGNAGIPITFTSPQAIPFNYTLKYLEDGVEQTVTITFAMLPYKIPISFTPPTTSKVYKLVSFTYNTLGTPVGGVVDETEITAYATPTPSVAGSTQSICGVTTTTLEANAPTIGNGLWQVTSGIGGTVLIPDSNTSQFNGLNGKSYSLRWTISNGTCTSASNVTINFTLLPDAPSATSSQTFCSGSTVASLSATAPTGSYVVWFDAATDGNEYISTDVLVTGYTYWAESRTGTCNSLTRTRVDVTVNPKPVFTVDGLFTDICDQNLFTLTTSFTSVAIPYRIYIYQDGSLVAGAPFTSSNALTYVWDENLTWGSLTPNTVYQYSITVIDNNNCSTTSSSTIDVNVWKIPVTGPQYHISNSHSD